MPTNQAKAQPIDEIRDKLFEKMMKAGVVKELTNKFSLIKDDELRVIDALNVMNNFEIVPSTECEEKDCKASANLREKANQIFVSAKNDVEKNIEAWELYSKSIATAPNLSQELSLAYANRSAVLLILGKHQECIDDINRAFQLNYPDHLKEKLFVRKIKCLRILSSTQNVIDTVEEATRWLRKIDFSDAKKEQIMEKFKDPKDKISVTVPKSDNIQTLPLFNSNPEVPAASSALAIKYSEQFGRYLVTTRKVNAGEILIMEKPYANILIPEESYKHCSQCLQVNWAMIPCDFCIYVMYCSQECKNKAWKSYHDIECPIYGYLLKLDFGKCNLFSMRLSILALREAGSVEKLRLDLKKADNCQDPIKMGFGEDGLYHSDKYFSIYNLVTNTEKRSMSDLFQRSLNAAFVLYYLCNFTTLLGKKFDSDIKGIINSKDATYIGGLILRNMQIVPSNMHTFEEERKTESADIGASALPVCSLINHSCNPNVSRCSNKEYMIIYAVKPIEEGSQIFDNYGMHYLLMDKTTRKEKCEQFRFTCECIACKEDWPMYSENPSFKDLLTNKEALEEVEKAYESLSPFRIIETVRDKPNRLLNVANTIETMSKYVSLPCKELSYAFQSLTRAFALSYGNSDDKGQKKS